ncbi:MAG: hypothetical protein RBG13Loki_2648 [Promethearchaeota archaeon CR_4]|nr:MAG: hypothetical protein RBG13Loki_2648 [Candidatus Lokiarchaeota archaeon CR_4]
MPEPTLSEISPNPDSDTSVDLDWTDVPLATYKVFRSCSEIYDVENLIPIASVSSSDFQDTVPEQGTYWYAIVATNATGDSFPSVSKHVRVDFGMPMSSWEPPVLSSIMPNPDFDGIIDLNWDLPTWPKVYNASDQFTDNTITPWTNPLGYVNTNVVLEQNVGIFAKALKLVDNNNTRVVRAERIFSAPTSGSIEIWVYPTRSDRQICIWIGTYNTVAMEILFDNDANIYALYGNAERSLVAQNYTPYTGYRVRFDFDTSLELWSLYINDSLLASNQDFWSSMSTLDRITLQSSEAEIEQVFYAAYPGFSWDASYDLGDNAYGVPNVINYRIYRNNSEILEIGSLTPIATPTQPHYTDHITTNGMYWYAIIASNGTDTQLSNSVWVTVFPDDVYLNGENFTLIPGEHRVTILDFDTITILMEFSLVVITTIEMVVMVNSTNPSSTDLAYALRYFTIEVYSGTYSSPILAKFYYNGSELTSAQENALGAFYLGVQDWENLEGLVYRSEDCVYVTLNHFSIFVIALTENRPEISGFLPWLLSLFGIIVVALMLIFRFRGKKTSNNNLNFVEFPSS